MWLTIAIFCTGWFILQFLMTVIFGSDGDLASPETSELDAGDFLSFKGLIHFGIGYSWWMVIHSGDSSWSTHAVAFLLGSLVMVILYLTYWGVSKLKKEIVLESGESLIGRTGQVYTRDQNNGEYTILITRNGSRKELHSVISDGENPETGQTVVIKDYKDGKYFIN